MKTLITDKSKLTCPYCNHTAEVYLPQHHEGQAICSQCKSLVSWDKNGTIAKFSLNVKSF